MEDSDIRKYKQVILIRSDIKMDVGKKCVQVAHAAVMGYNMGSAFHKEMWRRNGMRKIVLKVKNLEELESIVAKAIAHDIKSDIVIDAGLTQLEPGTVTCAGFEPLPEDSKYCKSLNDLTKDLKLL
jgi:PTH2 family peptidyl-tRNA hydrolase